MGIAQIALDPPVCPTTKRKKNAPNHPDKPLQPPLLSGNANLETTRGIGIHRYFRKNSPFRIWSFNQYNDDWSAQKIISSKVLFKSDIHPLRINNLKSNFCNASLIWVYILMESFSLQTQYETKTFHTIVINLTNQREHLT